MCRTVTVPSHIQAGGSDERKEMRQGLIPSVHLNKVRRVSELRRPWDRDPTHQTGDILRIRPLRLKVKTTSDDGGWTADLVSVVGRLLKMMRDGTVTPIVKW